MEQVRIMGRQAYVSNLESGTVSVIDLESRAVKNIDVGSYPVFSFLHPHDRTKLIVTLHNYKQKENEGALELVDLRASGKQTFSFQGIAMPSGMAYDKERDTLYVADENMDRIYVHNGKTLEQRRSRFKAGSKPVHVDISSDGRYLAITNRFSANLSLFELDKKHVNANRRISIDLRHDDLSYCHPYDVMFSRDPYICYVTDFGKIQDPLSFPGGLMIVDVKRRIVTNHIRVGNNPFGIALDKTGTTAYVCNFGGSSVSIVEPQ